MLNKSIIISLCIFLSLISLINSGELQQEQETIIHEDYGIDKTIYSNGLVKSSYYSGPVNVKYGDTFIPFEDYVSITNYNGDILLETIDGKKCKIILDYELKLGISATPTINIIQKRGLYYFTTDIGKEVTDMAYKFDCQSSFSDDTLYLMNIIKVDFKQARINQNITATYDSKDNKLNFSIENNKTGNLSFIDPFVTYNFSISTAGINATQCESANAFTPSDPPNQLMPQCNSGTADETGNAALDASDNNDVQVSISLDDEGYMFFIFNITENKNEIRNFTPSIEVGNTFADWVTTYWFIYNYSKSDWYLLDNEDIRLASGDVILEKNLNETVTHYFDGNKIYLLLTESENNQNAMRIDFVKVDVWYESTTLSFDEIPPNRTIEYFSEPLDIQINASNYDTFTINDSTDFNITKTGQLRNKTLLAIKSYYINISINDSSNNQNSTTLNINVTDTTPPQLTAINPENGISLPNNESIELKYSVYDRYTLDECWFSVLNVGTSVWEVANTTLTGCTNTTFNVSGSGTYRAYFYANDSFNNLNNSENSTFYVSISGPAINLVYPSDNQWINYLQNIPFNATSEDKDNISQCSLYGNFSGNWNLNKTNFHSDKDTGFFTNLTQSNFTLNLTDGDYIWNVYCNDSSNTKSFGPTNYTIRVDATYPQMNITSLSTTIGSQTITFAVNYTEKNIDSCKYSIYDSTNSIDGIYENISISCDSVGNLATVSDFGTFTMRVYGIDLAGNENSTNQSFTTYDTETQGPGGGGGEIIEELTCNTSDEKLSITTETGKEGYIFIIPYKTVRPIQKNIYITNSGNKNSTVSLRCEKTDNNSINICDFIELSKELTVIPPNPQQPSVIEMYISYPTDSTPDDEFSFNIIAESKYCIFRLNNKAYVNRIAPTKWKEINFSALNPEWDNLQYPVMLLGGILWIAMIVIGVGITKKTKSTLLGVFGVGVIGGLSVFFAVIVI